MTRYLKLYSRWILRWLSNVLGCWVLGVGFVCVSIWHDDASTLVEMGLCAWFGCVYVAQMCAYVSTLFGFHCLCLSSASMWRLNMAKYLRDSNLRFKNEHYRAYDFLKVENSFHFQFVNKRGFENFIKRSYKVY